MHHLRIFCEFKIFDDHILRCRGHGDNLGDILIVFRVMHLYEIRARYNVPQGIHPVRIGSGRKLTVLRT